MKILIKINKLKDLNKNKVYKLIKLALKKIKCYK